MTRLPKKITPDALLETYVEVYYTMKSPAEVAFGKFYEVLTQDFDYLRPPVETFSGLTNTLHRGIAAGQRAIRGRHGRTEWFPGLNCSTPKLGYCSPVQKSCCQ